LDFVFATTNLLRGGTVKMKIQIAAAWSLAVRFGGDSSTVGRVSGPQHLGLRGADPERWRLDP